ncbi:MAG: metallophosphoesterase family protein [Xanthobacteraceae bacterium]
MIDTTASIRSLKGGIREFGLLSLAKPASYVPAIASGVAQFCFQRSRVIDGIVISGDLATTGMTADIAVAREFVDETAVDGFVSGAARPTLQAAARPVYVIPGNHDRYTNNFAQTNSRTFDFNFGQYLRNYDGYVGHWVRRKRGLYIGFVFADFTLRARSDAESRWHAFGQGRVYEDVLKSLLERTFSLKAKYPGIALNWLVHFAPFDCGSKFLELIDWSNIASAGREAGVVTTLCGHTHQALKLQDGNHIVFCAGSAGCVDSESNSRVHILHYELDTTCSVRRENYRWNAKRAEFDRLPDD